uniref:Uncharacterized protein n=1 Tax=Anguilla anguilla TaxID=7936 RepID=A0A0E9VD43_ANGAN
MAKRSSDGVFMLRLLRRLSSPFQPVSFF